MDVDQDGWVKNNQDCRYICVSVKIRSSMLVEESQHVVHVHHVIIACVTNHNCIINIILSVHDSVSLMATWFRQHKIHFAAHSLSQLHIELLSLPLLFVLLYTHEYCLKYALPIPCQDRAWRKWKTLEPNSVTCTVLAMRVTAFLSSDGWSRYGNLLVRR